MAQSLTISPEGVRRRGRVHAYPLHAPSGIDAPAIAAKKKALPPGSGERAVAHGRAGLGRRCGVASGKQVWSAALDWEPVAIPVESVGFSVKHDGIGPVRARGSMLRRGGVPNGRFDGLQPIPRLNRHGSAASYPRQARAGRVAVASRTRERTFSPQSRTKGLDSAVSS